MSHPPGPPAPEQPGQPGPGAYPSGYGPVVPTNTKATAALITGISTLVLSWCCGLGLFGLVAVVLGLKARAEVRASQGRQTGDGLALAGVVTGAISALIGLAVVVLIVLVIVSGRTNFTAYER